MQPRFMTGVYGSFQSERVAKETRAGFAGIEASHLSSLEEAETVANYVREREMVFGVHFPLVKNFHVGNGALPLVTSQDEQIRFQAFEAIADELELIAGFGADYLVLHFPKPSILDSALDWSDWRFPYAGESILNEATNEAQQHALAFAAFAQLNELARKSSVEIVIEHDILHSLYYHSLLLELFRTFPGLGFCLDTGRLHLQQHTDPAFDAIRFIERMSPYITNVHLWTVRLGENRQGGHHPILPDLHPEDGWGDNAAYLRALSQIEGATVMFEHRSDMVTTAQLDTCYQWVEEMLRGKVNDRAK